MPRLVRTKPWSSPYCRDDAPPELHRTCPSVLTVHNAGGDLSYTCTCACHHVEQARVHGADLNEVAKLFVGALLRRTPGPVLESMQREFFGDLDMLTYGEVVGRALALYPANDPRSNLAYQRLAREVAPSGEED